ncbi:hypothetical protein ACK3SF_03915 [Candidatus Nanosalina sp. VS9-1]|uniref:hypothetical protein n=1 Tax=Candidatus Nanosalina sp. VS9-1 TaxID=3388566 RepID=UPI0039DFB73D
MTLENLASGPIGAYIVTGLFFLVLTFFILNELGLVRNSEDETEDPEDYES